MKNLAKIVTVAEKHRMYQKDKICWITTNEDGYEYIVPIETNIGDKLVAISEGSLLPEISRWEFLRKRCYMESQHAFLIKPMVMGKKANDDGSDSGERLKSWGLCVTLPEAGLDPNLEAGTDVTELLGLRKYEVDGEENPNTASSTNIKKTPKIIKWCLKHKLFRWIGNRYLAKHKATQSSFPSEIINKSDETTIQNCKSVISKFQGTRAFITAKMEGQSATMSLDPKNKYRLYTCSRNNRFDSINSVSKDFFHTAEIYDIEQKLKSYLKKTGVLLILQGERCAPGVQSCIYNFEDDKFFIYRMKGLENGKWVEYPYPRMKSIADELGFDCVPLLEVIDDMAVRFNVIKTSAKDDAGNDIDVYNTAEVIDSLVKYAEGILWKPTKDGIDYHYQPKAGEKLWRDYLQAEGVVIKSDDYNKEQGSGWSFKVKNVQYAEKKYSDMHETARKIICSLK